MEAIRSVKSKGPRREARAFLLEENRFTSRVKDGRLRTMRFRFADRKLEVLYTTGRGGKKFPIQVVNAFVRAVAVIDAAKDERDLYVQKGLRFEKLRGNRAGQLSIRLNDQFRLI